jgi:hypothetical protein
VKLTSAPAMRDEHRASWRRKGAASAVGFGSWPASPESAPSAASARDRATASSVVNVSLGGSGAGTKAA